MSIENIIEVAGSHKGFGTSLNLSYEEGRLTGIRGNHNGCSTSLKLVYDGRLVKVEGSHNGTGTRITLSLPKQSEGDVDQLIQHLAILYLL